MTRNQVENAFRTSLEKIVFSAFLAIFLHDLHESGHEEGACEFTNSPGLS